MMNLIDECGWLQIIWFFPFTDFYISVSGLVYSIKWYIFGTNALEYPMGYARNVTYSGTMPCWRFQCARVVSVLFLSMKRFHLHIVFRLTFYLYHICNSMTFNYKICSHERSLTDLRYKICAHEASLERLSYILCFCRCCVIVKHREWK